MTKSLKRFHQFLRNQNFTCKWECVMYTKILLIIPFNYSNECPDDNFGLSNFILHRQLKEEYEYIRMSTHTYTLVGIYQVNSISNLISTSWLKKHTFTVMHMWIYEDIHSSFTRIHNTLSKGPWFPFGTMWSHIKPHSWLQEWSPFQ